MCGLWDAIMNSLKSWSILWDSMKLSLFVFSGLSLSLSLFPSQSQYTAVFALEIPLIFFHLKPVRTAGICVCAHVCVCVMTPSPPLTGSFVAFPIYHYAQTAISHSNGKCGCGKDFCSTWLFSTRSSNKSPACSQAACHTFAFIVTSLSVCFVDFAS